MTDEPSAQHAALAAALEAGDEPDEALAARLGLALSEVAAARAARGALGGLLAGPGLAPAVGAGARVGRLELRALLGRGGMGEVWRAWDPQAEREVALKLLRVVPGPAERARFEAEGQAAARLRHPGIVTVHEAGTAQDGRPYLVLELVEGESLADALRRRGPLAPRDAARLGRDLARALEHAHGRGVLHRDVKPANVLVGRDGRARLADFGLARDALRERLTATGTVVGTPAYMAPEQAAGRPVDPRSDVWGLGATLVAALTGGPPDAGAPAQSFAREASARGLDRTLGELVGRCLAADPAGRPASAGAVADALDRWLAGEPARPRRRGLALAGVFVLAALGLGALATGRPPSGGLQGAAATSSGGADRPAPADAGEARRAVASHVVSLEAELAGGPPADLAELAAELERLDPPGPAQEPLLRARALAARALEGRVARAAALDAPAGARHPLQAALALARRLGLDLDLLHAARVEALARAPWAARIPELAARGDAAGVGLGLERLGRAAGLAPPLPLARRAELAAHLREAAWEAAGRRLATPEVTRAFVALEDALYYDLAPVGSSGPALEAIGEGYYEALRADRPVISAREAMAWARAGMYETNPGLWRTVGWLAPDEWALLASRPAASARLLEAAQEIPRFEPTTVPQRRRLAELLGRVVEAPIADLPPVTRAWVWIELGYLLDHGGRSGEAAMEGAGRQAAELLLASETRGGARRHPSDDGRGLVNLLGQALGLVVRGSKSDWAACRTAIERGEALLRARVASAPPRTGSERAAIWTLGRYLHTVALTLAAVVDPEAVPTEARVLARLDELADGALDLVEDLTRARTDRLARRAKVDPRAALAEVEAAWSTLRSGVRAAHEQRIDREVLQAGVALCETAASAAARAGDAAAEARWRAEGAALRLLE